MRRFFWSLAPRSPKEAAESVVENFLLHGFPAYVSRQSIAFFPTMWLGTINLSLFLVLAWTGILLMFYYIPSLERAYISIKDIEFAASFGMTLRAMHRWSGHLMVALVFLHMIRVWYTGAYKSPAGSSGYRQLNWLIGIALLLATLLFSFTGYLLPWDQLAYWAVVICSNIVSNVPCFGGALRDFIMGGTDLGQNTLIRFYVLHCALLPLFFLVAASYHLWRIKRDRGLAVTDQLRQHYGSGQAREPVAGKTYMLLGIKEKTRLTVSADDLPEDELTRSNRMLVTRMLLCFLLTQVVVFVLALTFPAPLEEPANPFIPPNPAKAPWYFLWLQELSVVTTINFGSLAFNGGLVGSVLIPGLAIVLLAIWPFIDKSPDASIGVWFHRSRLPQTIIFSLFVVALIALTVVGSYCRGPYWNFTWFGQF